MKSFEFQKQNKSETVVQDLEKGTALEKSPATEVDALVTEIESFTKYTLEISPDDLSKLENLKEEARSVRNRFGKILKATAVSSALLLGGIQSALASEPAQTGAETETISKPNADSEIFKRIEGYKEGLMHDTYERLAIYYDENEVFEKESDMTNAVALSDVEAETLSALDTSSLKSRTLVHTHPINAVVGPFGILSHNEGEAMREGVMDLPSLAPGSLDITTLQFSQFAYPGIENQSIVVDPSGVWYLSINLEHPATKRFVQMEEVMERLGKEIDNTHVPVEAGKPVEKIQSNSKQEELEHFVERANEVLGQEILDGIAMLDRAQYKLAKAKTPEVRQSAIHEYISVAKALGLEVQYEENDGDVYQ